MSFLFERIETGGLDGSKEGERENVTLDRHRHRGEGEWKRKERNKWRSIITMEQQEHKSPCHISNMCRQKGGRGTEEEGGAAPPSTHAVATTPCAVQRGRTVHGVPP